MRSHGLFFSVSVLFLFMISCSSVPMLNINYRAPEKTGQLAGKKVVLEIKDSRTDKDMLDPGAKEEFQNASESLSLSVAEGNEKGFKIGIFQLTDLMRQVFEERFKSFGITTLTDKEKTGGEPKVVIEIKAFKLELTPGTIKRNWRASMNYGIEISGNGKTLAGTTITGQSEKLKIIGKKEADSLASDLVTDLVNRVDMPALFKQAGL